MRENRQLTKAKSAKNDEFYTQYNDIQKEVNAYLEYNPDTFRGKTVLLPCDDPEWSKFTRFFAENFERLGLKKLISTSYAAASKNISATRNTKGKRDVSWYQPSLFEQESPPGSLKSSTDSSASQAWGVFSRRSSHIPARTDTSVTSRACLPTSR